MHWQQLLLPYAWAAGTLKLASLVQYVPLPVVGGYLGYVGYFCFASGASVATGERSISSHESLSLLLHAFPRTAIGVACALLVSWCKVLRKR